MTQFIHLRTYSDYSLGFSPIKIKDLVKYILKLGHPAVALTDRNNMFASLEFAMEAKKSGLQPINGLDICVQYEEHLYGNILLIAKNENGYENLIQIASDLYLNKKPNEKLAIDLSVIAQNKEGIIALVGNPINSIERTSFNENKPSLKHLDSMLELFADNLYIELIRKKSDSKQDVEYEEFLLDYAFEKNIPVVATNYASFLNQQGYEAQDILSCIATGRYVIEDDRPKLPEDFYLKSADEMNELFQDLPEALENTVLIAQRCSYSSNTHAPLLPEFADGEKGADDILAEHARDGLKKRIEALQYEIDIEEYQKRLEFELSIIQGMQYSGYFLIVSDFIKWSKANNIPVGPGRGSGVGSIVAWAIDITDLDPIKFGLLFERFLNPDRVSMPDFDIDFCQERREEVIQYVRRRYGNDKVAQIITFGKLQARAVLRDVGRVIHLPYPVVDKICKMVPNNPANPVTLAEAIALDKELQKSRDTDPTIEKLLKISLELEGVNRHASTHAAGVVIADRPITKLIPVYKDENAEMPAVQYTMKYAEAAGLVKFDFLGLKTLTVTSHTEKLINRNNGNFSILSVSLEDPKTYGLLSKGDTVGVFQFESAGMREAIKRLKPDNIGDLIALGSLYRPGPMDNIPSYINRKHGIEEVEVLHPLVENVLAETYGIIVYQEQVMEIARVLAGYTLGGADLLRRAMGKKIKAEMEAQREDFVQGCIKTNDISKARATEIFSFIEKFASYGFNKSHAAAYAIISYQTAYLKANYPLEFLIASLNLEIDDVDKINIFLNEARKFNIKVLLPNINKSQAYFTIEGDSIRFGLGAIRNVGVKAIKSVIEEREAGGEFKDIYDLMERAPEKSINRRMFESLAKSGALDAFSSNRRQFLESTDQLLRYAFEFHESKTSKQVMLFDSVESDASMRPALAAPDEWSSNELLHNEFESLGFYLSSHPLELYKSKLDKLFLTSSQAIPEVANAKSQKLSVAGVVTSKKIKSSKRGKYAFIQISDMSGLLEISIFKEELLYAHNAILQVGNLLYFRVDVRIDDTGLRAVVESIEMLETVVSQITGYIKVLITESGAAQKIKELLTDSGNVISLSYKSENGDIVEFASEQRLYISQENENKLRKISGVVVS